VQHQAEHQELIRSAQELQQEILHSKEDYTDEHLQFLERWLTEHILTSDGRLGAYLSRVM
jgi:hemerythrin